MKRDTTRHIPTGYKLIAKDERFGFEVYGDQAAGKYFAICFRGKAIKPAWHYSFRTEEALKNKIEETLRFEMEAADRKAKRQAEKKAACASHDVKLGDVFRCSWGYDQTNIDYYQVVSVSGQMAVVRAIGAMSETTAWEQGESVPALGHFIGDSFRVKIQKWDVKSEPYFKVNSFSNAYRMKPVAVIAGAPVYESSSWTSYA
jgi:hypothetical protein